MKRLTVILLFAALVVGCGRTYKMDEDLAFNERPWPFFRGDQQAVGAISTGEYGGRLDIIWEAGTNDKPAGPLTLTQEVLVYPSSRKRIKMYQMSDGDYRGRIKTKGWPDGGMSVWNQYGWYVVGHDKNELRALDLTRKDQVWETKLYNPLGGVLFVDDGMVVAGSREGYLLAMHPSEGTQRWKYQTEDYRFATPPVYTGKYIIQPTDDGSLLVLSPEDGSEIGRVELDGAIVAPVAVGDYVYANDLDGGVYAIDIERREIVWKQTTEGPIWTSPTVADGRLFVAHSGGVVLAFDAISGKLLWSVEIGDVIGASPIVAGSHVVFGTKSGKLYSLRVEDGKSTASRRFKGAFSVSPVTDGTFIYVATDKGEIACLGTAQRATLYGKVMDKETSELLVGAKVSIPSLGVETLTDINGRFRIETLPPGVTTVKVSSVGFWPDSVQVSLNPDRITEARIELRAEPFDKDKIIY